MGLAERKIDKNLEKKLIFPKNPTFQVEEALSQSKNKTMASQLRSKVKKVKNLVSLIEFCKQKNIPFCENEKRYYELLRNRQNYKYWADNWKQYCNVNIVDPPPKPKVENSFIKALMALAKRNADAAANNQ